MGDVRNITLTGKVVMADGSPPPEPVAIERMCSAKTVRVGYTDATGFFNFPLVETLPSMQDASESGGDAYAARSVVSFNVNNSNPQQPPLQAAGPVNALSTMEGCDLRASLPGFSSSRAMIHVVGLIGSTNVGTIVLAKSEQQAPIVSATSMDVPKHARQAYEKASSQLKKNKLADAQKELEQAVRLYPRYAEAWADLGWLQAKQSRLDEARTAFAQAREADDKFVPAYVGLSSVAVRQSKWVDAQQFSARATELDNKRFPVAFYYNAVANLQLGQLEKAEKSARMADQLDTQRTLPQVKLLLGTILDMEQHYAEAAEQFKLYLKFVPQARNAEHVQRRVTELEKLSTTGAALVPASLSSSVAAAPTAEVRPVTPPIWQQIGGENNLPRPTSLIPPKRWAPPDIDEMVPPVSQGVPCPVQDVVKRVSARVRELKDNLQEFTATERIEHFEVDQGGNPHQPSSATYKYIAEIKQTPKGDLSVEEYRDGVAAKQSFLGQRSATGMVAHALLFHPNLIGDLTITCEGLGNLQGRPAWQLRFVQKPDRPFRTYFTTKGAFPIEMKGRVWAAVDSYHVIRVETDLVKPVTQINLLKDHLIIDYQPVEFAKRNIELWLPQTAYLYLDYANRRTYRKHTFSDFGLFSVDVTEKTKQLAEPD